MGELKGYKDFEEVDRYFMLCIWQRYDHLDTVLGDKWPAFAKWFREQATYPDYIRRAREALVQHGLVEVPSYVKRRAQGKARAFQSQFGNS